MYCIYKQIHTLLETEKRYYNNAFALKYAQRASIIIISLINITFTNDSKFGYLFHFLTINVRIKIYF